MYMLCVYALLALTPLFLKTDPGDIETEHGVASQVIYTYNILYT